MELYLFFLVPCMYVVLVSYFLAMAGDHGLLEQEQVSAAIFLEWAQCGTPAQVVLTQSECCWPISG